MNACVTTPTTVNLIDVCTTFSSLCHVPTLTTTTTLLNIVQKRLCHTWFHHRKLEPSFFAKFLKIFAQCFSGGQWKKPTPPKRFTPNVFHGLKKRLFVTFFLLQTINVIGVFGNGFCLVAPHGYCKDSKNNGFNDIANGHNCIRRVGLAPQWFFMGLLPSTVFGTCVGTITGKEPSTKRNGTKDTGQTRVKDKQ